MSIKKIKIDPNVNDPVSVEVEMPKFDNIDNIMINYQIWLIYGNVKQDIARGTNTDNEPDKFLIPFFSQDLKNKILRIDYTLINGTNIKVKFICSISKEHIEDTLNSIFAISCFIFE